LTVASRKVQCWAPKPSSHMSMKWKTYLWPTVFTIMPLLMTPRLTLMYLAHTARPLHPRLQNCIAEVVDWCGAHSLQLNASKTDLLWYGSSAALQSLSSSEKNIVVGGDTIVPADVVRDLGVQFDCELNMSADIAKTT